jgi:hypothetical protein
VLCLDIPDTARMNNVPIAAIDNTSGARVNDTRHCFLSGIDQIRNSSMCSVAWGAAVYLETSMSEDPKRRYAYFVRFRFMLVSSRLWASLDTLNLSGDRFGPMSHVFCTPECLIPQKCSSIREIWAWGKGARSIVERGRRFGTQRMALSPC